MSLNVNWFDSIGENLRLFEKKILYGIGAHVRRNETKRYTIYTIHLTEFGLDLLNPSDITERLSNLKNRTVSMAIGTGKARVPLLTDVRYDDPSKTVTITFNSLLKGGYLSLGEKAFSQQVLSC
ncbi:hypothetical protein PU629_05485 [Pullulanibacillus sp. KACC 23026]|uniref:RepB family plasmid replication initiator protein n=1 Tax=Pullulanibacillus sp. KACC 23026 TaxID=3028315 RepID=UPI0023B049F8|nr:RepB family plasmid replication initiator protein [Pullulanibacillus sp. KACC 23026]WEG13819.1 hypothetical protein PU629_05485 [Pullulanibacillus sp. KACC 23026]